MNEIKFLFSAVGHPTTPGIISSLKNNGERNIKITGVDMEPTRVITNNLDNFYKVPKFTDSKFITKILEICKKDKIDVYWPRREEEAFLTCKYEKKFDKLGVKLIRPGSEKILQLACNKNNFHDFFNKNKIPYAKYCSIKSFDDLEKIKEKFRKNLKIVLKPAESSGGRGAVLINNNIKYDSKKTSGILNEYTFDEIKNRLKNIPKQNFPELIAMEYLTGKYYSVDVLSKNGKILFIIPKLRILGTPSNTLVGKINFNKNIEKLVSSVCKSFKFNFLQNYEIILDKNNKPFIYDINPRGGASIAFCAAAGVNLLYLSIKMALNEKIPSKLKINNNLKMIRAHQEYYD